MQSSDPDTSEMKWYVLKVQTNREGTIKSSLERKIRREGCESLFGRIVIPTEKVIETKGGKRKVKEHKLYPGYIFVQMHLNDESWYLVRDTSGVGDFTGAAGRPMPMMEDEVARMLGRQDDTSQAELKVRIEFTQGDVVKIKAGPFESFEGVIDRVDELTGKITVLIEIFGRPTPVELEHHEVERP